MEVIFPSGIFVFLRILLFFFLYLFFFVKSFFYFSFFGYLQILLLIRSGDIETNPGPKKQCYLNFFHWNLNGVAVQDFIKLPLIEIYIATNNFDTVCLSQTSLDSSISNDDNRIT